MDYPNDANGDVLRRMQAKGDDLEKPRNLDFTVVFANETSAREFARRLHALGYTTSIENNGTLEDFPWEVIVGNHMKPLHAEIGAFERLLQSLADTLGGHNGWGCFSPPENSDGKFGDGRN
jgi:hypothetical protein